VARVLALALILPLVVLGCGGGSDDQGASKSSGRREPQPVLPSGGEVPAPKITDLERAAGAAGCKLQSTTARSRDHIADIQQRVHYDTNPPTSGKHFQVPAQDGIYEQAPPDTTVVHSMEHGRVVIWLRPNLPASARAGLRALVEDDSYQMLLVPRSKMPFAVAATAWNASPGPEGTGRLLGCPSFNSGVYDALRDFRDQNRGRGPESVP
jgi:hypothetical protein